MTQRWKVARAFADLSVCLRLTYSKLTAAYAIVMVS